MFSPVDCFLAKDAHPQWLGCSESLPGSVKFCLAPHTNADGNPLVRTCKCDAHHIRHSCRSLRSTVQLGWGRTRDAAPLFLTTMT